MRNHKIWIEVERALEFFHCFISAQSARCAQRIVVVEFSRPLRECRRLLS
jgi:hypothetical protein